MTISEQEEIDRWFDAVQKTQPSGTLAALFYVRDGTVYLGRGEVALEAKMFPADNAPMEACIGDLENAAELIAAEFEKLIELTRTNEQSQT